MFWLQIAWDYDCNAEIFTSYARDRFRVNILRILECEELIQGNLMCALIMLENDSYMLILIGNEVMNNEIQSYVFLELIKFVIIVSIILCILTH